MIVGTQLVPVTALGDVPTSPSVDTDTDARHAQRVPVGRRQRRAGEDALQQADAMELLGATEASVL